MYTCMNVDIYFFSRANGSEVHYYDLVNLRESLTGNLGGCALSWFSSTVAGVMRRRYVIGSYLVVGIKIRRTFNTLAGSINIGV